MIFTHNISFIPLILGKRCVNWDFPQMWPKKRFFWDFFFEIFFEILFLKNLAFWNFFLRFSAFVIFHIFEFSNLVEDLGGGFFGFTKITRIRSRYASAIEYSVGPENCFQIRISNIYKSSFTESLYRF